MAAIKSLCAGSPIAGPGGDRELFTEKRDPGLPKRRVNRLGRVDDFNVLEAGSGSEIQSRCEQALQKPGRFSTPVQKILDLAFDWEVQVILVEMPMPSAHRARFYSLAQWQKLRTAVQERARTHGVQFVDASDWIRDDANLEDATHLGREGAKTFGGLLARAISDPKASLAPVGLHPCTHDSRFLRDQTDLQSKPD